MQIEKKKINNAEFCPKPIISKFVKYFDNSINFHQSLHLSWETNFYFVYCHQSALSVCSAHVKQAPPTFAGWLSVQIGAGNQTPGMKGTSALPGSFLVDHHKIRISAMQFYWLIV